jgi:ABC-type sugar transport system substrate-binding protein
MLRSKLMQSVVSSAVLVLAAVVLAACGSDSDSGSGGTASGGSASGGKKTAGDLKVVYSLYDRQAAFFRGCVDGAEKAAKDRGIDLKVQVSGPDPTKQIQQIENVLLAKPDALILTSIDAAAVEPVLKKVTEAGIPIIGLCDEAGAIKREAGPERLSYIGPDYHLTGIKKAEFITETLKKQNKADGAKLGAFFGVRGVPFDVGSRAGIQEVMDKYPGIKYVKGPYGGEYTAEAGLQAAQNLLAGSPDLDGLSCDNSDLCVGAAKAVDDAGIDPDDIVVASNDAIPPELDLVREGKIDYTVGWCSYDEGGLAIKQIVDLLVNGKAPPEYTLDKGRDINAQGMELKSENIDSKTITADTSSTNEPCSEPAFEVIKPEPKQEQLTALGLD